MPHYVNRPPGWTVTLAVVLVVAAVAVATRLPGLSTTPPGLLLAEARAALEARSIDLDTLSVLPHDRFSTPQSLVFGWLTKATGSILGWDVSGVRSAAALLGIATAVICALWYRRALGRTWGLIGGLLVATSFWQLMFSRLAISAIAAATVAALGLWCLWRGLRAAQDPGDRARLWHLGAGLSFGLGVYTHPSLLPIILVVPALAAFLIWGRTEGQSSSHDARQLGVMVGSLLVAVLPLAVYGAAHPSRIAAWIEQDWDNDGVAEQIGSVVETASGYAISAGSIVWNGADAPSLNLSGRPLLDPILALLFLAGFALAARHPRTTLHGVALIWTAGFLLPAAIVDPGNPQLLLPLTPVVFLFPLLAVHAGTAYIREHRPPASRFAAIVAALAITCSAFWSLHDYFQRWSDSTETYIAFNGDVRDALEAVEHLPNDGAPVYFATTPEQDPLIEYLAPDLASDRDRFADGGIARQQVDSETTLIVPTSGGGYLVYPVSSAPTPELLGLLDGQEPIRTGRTPDGDAAYYVWAVGQSAREQLPYTLPTIHFPHGFDLVGFAIAPDFGDFASSGELPDEPRVDVTLVWSVPTGVAPHAARVRLVPIPRTDTSGPIPTGEVRLAPSPAVRGIGSDRELIIARVSVPVPETAEMIIDVEATLIGPNGTVLAPLEPPSAIVGDYAHLNRVQYIPSAANSRP